jgi:hypothetical protein
MVCLDRPVLADEAGQVAGDGVDGLPRGLARSAVLVPAGDLDGLAGVREVQAADVGGLQGAGLGAAVPGLAGDAVGRYLPPGQRPLSARAAPASCASRRRCNGLSCM